MDFTVSVSKQDWSLHRKGPTDQARHNAKIKEAIKENLGDIIAEEAIITSDGKKIVKVPVRSLDLPRGFHLVLLPFNTLMHFEELADQDRVIAAAAACLVRGGYLWISLFHPDLARPAGVVRSWKGTKPCCACSPTPGAIWSPAACPSSTGESPCSRPAASKTYR